MHARPVRPESIHPSLWRASQLARGGARGVDTGHAALSVELPGGGWPPGRLIELLLPQPGIGELRLLLPVLRRFGRPPGRRSILLIQPPHLVQPLALSWWGVDPDRLVLLRASQGADACWAAEQALQAGTCDVILLWQGGLSRQGHGVSGALRPVCVRPDVLRRLNLAAQSGDALFFMFRPLCDAAQPSPAPLRLALAPAHDGICITFAKRHGPRRDEPLFVPLTPSPILLDHHVRLDRRAPVLVQPRSAPAAADHRRDRVVG